MEPDQKRQQADEILRSPLTDEEGRELLQFRDELIAIAEAHVGRWWHDPFLVHSVKRKAAGLSRVHLSPFFVYRLGLPKHICTFLLSSPPKPEMHYPYNESFDFYGEPRAGRRAQEFIDARNRCKGGRWVLHTHDQYVEWQNRIGQHRETIRMIGKGVIK